MTVGQTPDCNSHTFRHPPGAHLDPCIAGSCQELGHILELLQAPAPPSSHIYHQRLKSQVFRLQSKDCLYPLWGKLPPQELLFLAVCRFGIYIWFMLSLCNHREFSFFLNSEFLDDAVEETATRKTCWFAKPPQYTPIWLYREWGFSGPWALATAQQGVYLGEQITQQSLEQHLVLLPTETHKSNISILLASELLTN